MLEIHITLDGSVVTHSYPGPASGIYYFVCNHVTLSMESADPKMAFLYEGRSVKVEAESTGGTVGVLTCNLEYAKF